MSFVTFPIAFCNGIERKLPHLAAFAGRCANLKFVRSSHLTASSLFYVQPPRARFRIAQKRVYARSWDSNPGKNRGTPHFFFFISCPHRTPFFFFSINCLFAAFAPMRVCEKKEKKRLKTTTCV
ncbi:hypothetical protein BC940DRAFT_297299, partial [Gongronella butleri]